MAREPRRFTIVSCFDCGYAGNRWDIQKDIQYGWEKPWDEYTCPQCGESCGPEFEVVEVVPSEQTQPDGVSGGRAS